jgi:glycine cleavage system H protein
MTSNEDLLYSADHEWARREGDTVRIGITNYAQDALGDVVYVQIPEIGRTVTAGESFGEVESTKSVSDIYAPISGQIVAVNETLADKPELLNSDPYGNGWLCVISIADASQLDQLMDTAAYEALVAE